MDAGARRVVLDTELDTRCPTGELADGRIERLDALA
jgi:hypothetical protein